MKSFKSTAAGLFLTVATAVPTAAPLQAVQIAVGTAGVCTAGPCGLSIDAFASLSGDWGISGMVAGGDYGAYEIRVTVPESRSGALSRRKERFAPQNDDRWLETFTRRTPAIVDATTRFAEGIVRDAGALRRIGDGAAASRSDPVKLYIAGSRELALGLVSRSFGVEAFKIDTALSVVSDEMARSFVLKLLAWDSVHDADDSAFATTVRKPREATKLFGFVTREQIIRLLQSVFSSVSVSSALATSAFGLCLTGLGFALRCLLA